MIVTGPAGHDYMVMSAGVWIGLVEHASWPVAIVVLVLALRRQIGDFLTALGGRITELSAMAVSIDLAMAADATRLGGASAVWTCAA